MMRYDTPVSFAREKNKYNNKTGNTETVISYQTEVLANVSDTSAEMSSLMYGQVKKGTYTIIIQGKPPHVFDCILIGGKKYTVDKSRETHLTSTYFLSGGT